MTQGFIDSDYIALKNQLLKQFNYKSQSNIIEKKIISIHKRIFSLCNLIHHISKSENDGNEFLKELHSDAVQILVTIPLGITKATILFLRSMIENILKHLYYKHHPIELATLIENGDSRLLTIDLINYLKDHPFYNKRNNFVVFVNHLKSNYHELSRVVHGTSPKYFMEFQTISHVDINRSDLDDIVKKTNFLISQFLTIIIILHKSNFESIHPKNKRPIFDCISNQHKKMIHDID